MAKLSALGHVGLAFETTYGVGVAPVVYIPYETIKADDSIKKVIDEARRGQLSKEFQAFNATRSGSVDLDSDMYPSLAGYFLKAILGQDTVTGTAAPYSHKFQVVNAQAPSLTLSDYNSMTERQYKGAVLEELSFKFDTENTFKMSSKFISMASIIVTETSPTMSLEDPFMGFQTQLSLNGSNNTNLVGGEISIKRETKLIYGANNTQDPTKVATGRIEASGKLTFDVEDESELELFLGGVQPSMLLKVTRDANTEVDFSLGKIDIDKATVDRSQEFVRVDLDFKALYNIADAGNITITLKNAVASY